MPSFNVARRRSYCVYRRSARQLNRRKHVTAQGFGSVGVLLCACTVLTGVLYLFSTNDIAIKGDEIYDIEKEIQRLSRENEQLVIQEAQLRSLENVESIVEEKGMQEVTEPVYVDRETYVALDQ